MTIVLLIPNQRSLLKNWCEIDKGDEVDKKWIVKM